MIRPKYLHSFGLCTDVIVRLSLLRKTNVRSGAVIRPKYLHSFGLCTDVVLNCKDTGRGSSVGTMSAS